jgi:hypothetical protein
VLSSPTARFEKEASIIHAAPRAIFRLMLAIASEYRRPVMAPLAHITERPVGRDGLARAVRRPELSGSFTSRTPTTDDGPLGCT